MIFLGHNCLGRLHVGFVVPLNLAHEVQELGINQKFGQTAAVKKRVFVLDPEKTVEIAPEEAPGIRIHGPEKEVNVRIPLEPEIGNYFAKRTLYIKLFGHSILRT